MRSILAIDQSTSATKALLFDKSGELIEKASLEHRQIYPRPGWVEHEAEEIWRNVVAVIEQVVHRSQPACLSITNQRETFVVFDRATGKPLHNAIVWQCRRGEDVCARLRHAGHEKLIARKTGLKIDTYFSASKIAQLMRDRPDIARNLESGDAVVGTIDAYLVHRLTAGRIFATDHTNASRTLLFDIDSLKWDEQLCELFGVPVHALPEVRDSTAQFGIADVQGRMLPICGVIGDSQAALLGHRCCHPGAAKVTLGSGSSILLNVGQHRPRASDGAVAAIAWTHAGRATYCLEGIINYSAATIAWLKDQLHLIASLDETETAAMSVADSDGVYFVPAFAGLSAPYWSPGARAAIVGMSAHTTREHIIRAALESIAYQIRDVLEMMSAGGSMQLRSIHADGGATRNRFLMQFIADLTRLEIIASSVPDRSARGAAFAGAVGMNLIESFDELMSFPEQSVHYTPKMPRDQAALLHAGWKRAVHQVLAGAAAQ
jgi:glycerol kinase